MTMATEQRITLYKGLLLILVLNLYLVIGASSGLAESKQTIGNVTVYKDIPSAYELAEKLYPAKRRAIVIGKGNASKNTPRASVAFAVNFEYDSTNVQKDSLPYLDALGDMLNFSQLKDKSLKIEGHADASGDEYYNLQLSEARAQSIKHYLQSVHRIDPKRLYVQGYGETKLLDQERPYDQINRRAEFSAWQSDSE